MTTRAHYLANRERILAQARVYNAANKEKKAAYAREYNRKRRAANAEGVRQVQRDWRAKNKDVVIAYRKAHYERHAEAIRERARLYHRANKEARAAYARRNKERLAANAAKWRLNNLERSKAIKRRTNQKNRVVNLQTTKNYYDEARAFVSPVYVAALLRRGGPQLPARGVPASVVAAYREYLFNRRLLSEIRKTDLLRRASHAA